MNFFCEVENKGVQFTDLKDLQSNDQGMTNLFFVQLVLLLMASAVQLHFIQCPFPNQIQFGLEKLHPKIAYNFPNQFQFGLERKKLILQDADSKPNSDWFGKFWWPLSMSWKFQTKFSLVWKNHWLLTLLTITHHTHHTPSSSAGGFINYFSKSYIITSPGGCIEPIALTKMTSWSAPASASDGLAHQQLRPQLLCPLIGRLRRSFALHFHWSCRWNLQLSNTHEDHFDRAKLL